MKAVKRLDGCLVFPEDFVRLNRQMESAHRKPRLEDRLVLIALPLLFGLLFIFIWLNLQAIP